MKIHVVSLAILLAQCAAGAGLSGTWEGTFADADTSFAGFDLGVPGNQVNGDAYLALRSLGFSNIYRDFGWARRREPVLLNGKSCAIRGRNRRGHDVARGYVSRRAGWRGCSGRCRT